MTSPLTGGFGGADVRAKLHFVRPRTPLPIRTLYQGTVVARNPSFVLAADGRCLHVNRALLDLVGCTQDSFMTAWTPFLHPNGTLFRAELRESPTVAVFGFHRRLSATARYISTSLRTLYDRDNLTILGYVGRVRAMTVLPTAAAVDTEQSA